MAAPTESRSCAGRVDFAIEIAFQTGAAVRAIIEIDGSGSQAEQDAEFDSWVRAAGWEVLRFPVSQISEWQPAVENLAQKVTEAWRGGRLEEVPEELLKDTLSDQARDSLGRIHPACMGGEYLPDYLPGETEIARIELLSTTADVISIPRRWSRQLL